MTQRTSKRGQPAAPSLDWHIDEHDDKWPPQLLSAAPLVQPAKRNAWRRQAWVVCAALLLLLIAAGWKWHSVQADRSEIESQIARTINASQWAEQAQVELLEVKEDKALVRVYAQRRAGHDRYRMTRVYQRNSQGWQPAPPVAALWGKVKRLETRYFILNYRARDAEAVESVAAQLDALYLRFYGSFFAALPIGDKEVITIDPAIDPDAASKDQTASQTLDQLTLPSPAVALVPARISEAQMLLRDLAPLLLDKLAKEAISEYANPLYAGSFAAPLYYAHLTDAIRIEQLVALDVPAELWPVVPPAANDEFLQSYALDICAMRQVQLTAPALLSIPSVTDQLDSQPQTGPCTAAWHDLMTPQWHLWQLLAFIPPEANPFSTADMEQIGPSHSPAATAGLASVFAYADVAYGPRRLPLLLATYDRLHTWDSLAKTVYGVSGADFEAGWRAYVAARYK